MTDQTLAETTAVDLKTQRLAIVSEAISVIDEALAQMMRRELMSAGEVADLLLDVRTLLTAKH